MNQYGLNDEGNSERTMMMIVNRMKDLLSTQQQYENMKSKTETSVDTLFPKKSNPKKRH